MTDTIGLVLLPTETGGGADKTTLSFKLNAAHLLLTKGNNKDKASDSKTDQNKKENRRAHAEHTKNRQEKNKKQASRYKGWKR
ncbi:hypothetical protein DBR43_14985 [Pedobacter sp. KBW06]|uniref:hypothetical protein n=1 Tax=Pedobacter sp. KBW06 TaxID=2153359 RepID=UPI000F5B4D26|nr:hypothetical protein [Pedobacter sp. KBW06]RQO69389.1 hypothetical protein DBR43_14985 [Pedobacter sp. KBW06]